MSAKHTPGPWWVTDSGVRDRGGYICHTNAATRYPDQDERYERETAERAANRRLIAAAPEMYEALRYIVERENFAFAECSEAEEIWSRARAAIAAATGEQS